MGSQGMGDLGEDGMGVPGEDEFLGDGESF